MLAETNWVIIILLRWLHVITACVLIGGTFFLAAILSAAAEQTSEGTMQQSPYSRTRRPFKMLVHISILFLLGSGIYNAISNWSAYRAGIPLTHALFGPHVLLAVIALTILLVIFTPREPRNWHRRGLQIAVAILLLAVLCASALKYALEHPRQRADESPQQTISKAIG